MFVDHIPALEIQLSCAMHKASFNTEEKNKLVNIPESRQ